MCGTVSTRDKRADLVSMHKSKPVKIISCSLRERHQEACDTNCNTTIQMASKFVSITPTLAHIKFSSMELSRKRQAGMRLLVGTARCLNSDAARIVSLALRISLSSTLRATVKSLCNRLTQSKPRCEWNGLWLSSTRREVSPALLIEWLLRSALPQVA